MVAAAEQSAGRHFEGLVGFPNDDAGFDAEVVAQVAALLGRREEVGDDIDALLLDAQRGHLHEAGRLDLLREAARLGAATGDLRPSGVLPALGRQFPKLNLFGLLAGGRHVAGMPGADEDRERRHRMANDRRSQAACGKSGPARGESDAEGERQHVAVPARAGRPGDDHEDERGNEDGAIARQPDRNQRSEQRPAEGGFVDRRGGDRVERRARVFAARGQAEVAVAVPGESRGLAEPDQREERAIQDHVAAMPDQQV